MSRLFSHHDRLFLVGGEKHHAETLPGSIYMPHFHKTFGLLALLHFLVYQTPYHATLVDSIGKERLMMLSICHVILAVSSFEFRVGRARNGLYTIYREMQLHTIIFTMRSWTVMIGAWLFGIENIVYRMAYVLFWHVMADVATKYYAPPSKETTIRRSVDGKTGYQHHAWYVHIALFIFSFSQLVGTFLMMVDTPNAVRNAMFVMTPVQVSAFLATLVRKGYVKSETSFGIYFTILLPIFIYHPWAPIEVAFMVLAGLLRFKLRVNKYVMWIGLGLAFAYLQGDLAKVLGMPEELAPPSLPAVAWQRVQPASAAGAFFEKITGMRTAAVRMDASELNTVYAAITPNSF